MKNTLRFQKAYDSLIRAYFEGTLAKGTCVACACGNIISDAMGGNITSHNQKYECNVNNSFWGDLFVTDEDHNQQITITLCPNEARKIEELTGYSAEEMAKVEHAFEVNSNIDWREYKKFTEQEILEDQFNGLIAVVDVLLELDGMIDNGHKVKFRKHPKLQIA